MTTLAAAHTGMPCWNCNERLPECARPDCPRVWRVRDPIELAGEGRMRG